MKSCGDLETAVIAGADATRSAVIVSPDRWLAGIYAAAARFIAWERDRVQSGWLGATLTVAHGTSRRVIPLARLALDAEERSLSLVSTSLHPLLRLGADARVRVIPLRHGDVVQLHTRAGEVRRIALTPADAITVDRSTGSDRQG